MRKIWLSIIGLLLLTGAAQAQMCGSGVQCFNATLNLSNANAGTANTTFPVYTAPATGNGAKIVAVYNYSTATSGATAFFAFLIIHNGTPTLMWAAYGSDAAVGPLNMLVTSAIAPPAPIPNLPTDENGNSFILLSPGDTFAIENGYAIPASGITSGTWGFDVMGQQY